MRSLSLLIAAAALFATACNRDAAPAAQQPVAVAVVVPAPPPDPQKGEKAPFEIQGDVVKVNNRLCAVSHSVMAENTLGQFVSRVKYDGPDARFSGKTFEFNQCCGMCIEKFPSLWAQNRDGILAFHGLK